VTGYTGKPAIKKDLSNIESIGKHTVKKYVKRTRSTEKRTVRKGVRAIENIAKHINVGNSVSMALRINQ
jgi:hypothetical protein